MNNKYHIGQVGVVKKDPPNGNPYRGDSLIGPPRREALRKFKHGEPTPDLEFWYQPSSGGAKRITSDDVDWNTSSIV